ncbi:hypothetical protein CRV08_14540 [Halarcobacter ebronensis]|uniref:Uncharacterized protein n=1 Tax=Halarcobacter ebronensis TaxID=1462615 RepID=A0A4Q0Y9X6_9BACT|nr:hypothetical protein [Halarcobacter ebronensis]RXJ65809.1 hypothetical protein CRV08_14540 [Halarcobacter ebronensis]
MEDENIEQLIECIKKAKVRLARLQISKTIEWKKNEIIKRLDIILAFLNNYLRTAQDIRDSIRLEHKIKCAKMILKSIDFAK